MIIGVDLDGTYAADLPTWRRAVQVFIDAGHKCVLITNRGPEDLQIVESLVQGQMPILFCSGRPKRAVAHEAGYAVDVWMDDNPILVDLGAAGLAQVGVQH